MQKKELEWLLDQEFTTFASLLQNQLRVRTLLFTDLSLLDFDSDIRFTYHRSVLDSLPAQESLELPLLIPPGLPPLSPLQMVRPPHFLDNSLDLS